MTAKTLDLTIEQGADFEQVFLVTVPDDLTGFSAYLQIRAWVGNPATILRIDSSGGELTVDTIANAIVANIPAEVTAAIIPGRYVYDLKLASPAGKLYRPYKGSVYVDGEVTTIEDTPIIDNAVLLQGGDLFLLQDGSTMLLQGSGGVAGDDILLESGGYLLSQTGEHIQIEGA